MKVYYLFSNNKKVGSKLISWGSSFFSPTKDIKDIPSHAAILIQDGLDGIVIESTMLTGVRIIPYRNWKLINNEVAKIQCRQKVNIAEKISNMWGKKYDWIGLVSFSYYLIKSLITEEELPKNNKWQRKNSYICTEFVGEIENIDYEMKTPDMMLQELRDRGIK